ncbi:MAG TPA: hypothetical protein VF516_37160, partial [Kofleriaceae bacterium]
FGVSRTWAAYTEFVDVGTGPQEFSLFANGTILNIPVGWVPTAALNYGGIAALTQVSLGLDKFGVWSYDEQLVFLLNAVPLVGIALGFGFGEGGYGPDYKGNTGWYDSFKGFLHDRLSMESI